MSRGTTSVKQVSERTTFRLRVHWGRGIKDEFHKEKHSGSPSIKIMDDLSGNAKLWFLSGTLFEMGSIDMIEWINILRTTAWDDDEELKKYTDKHLRALDKLCQKGINAEAKGETLDTKTLEQIKDANNRFRDLCVRMIIRRQFTSTMFDNKPVVKLPPHRKKDVFVDLNPVHVALLDEHRLRAEQATKKSLAKQVAEWKKAKCKGEQPTQPSTEFLRKELRLLRAYTNFPGLAKLVQQHADKREELDFTVVGMDEEGCFSNEIRDQSVFAKNLDSTIKGAPKIAELKKVLDSLQDKNVKNEKGELVSKAKIIVSSSIPIAAFIFFLVSLDIPCPEGPSPLGR